MIQKFLKEAAISMAVTAILWGLAECGLRWYVRNFRDALLSDYKIKDVDLGWALKPGYASSSIHINSLGYRGREFSLQKKEGVIRIVCEGDSCVFGSPVGDADTIPFLLEDCLKAKGFPVEVINAGVSGYGSSHVRAKLQRDILLLNPDLVIIYAGWNDLFSYYPGDPQYQRSSEDLFNRILEKSYVLKLMVKIAFQKIRPLIDSFKESDPDLYENYLPVQFINNYQDMINQLKSHNIQILSLTLPSLLGDEHLDEYKEKLVYPFFTTKTDLLKILWNIYNREIKRIAGSDVFDLAHFIRCIEREGELFVDTHHPNEKGNRLIAERICNYLLRSF